MDTELKKKIKDTAYRAGLDIQEALPIMDTHESRYIRADIIEKAILHIVENFMPTEEGKPDESPISRFMEQWESDCREMSDGEKIKRLAVLVDLYKADK